MEDLQKLSKNSKINVIIWSQTRNLKWSDFKEKSNFKSRSAASSAIGFESEPILNHIETGGKFRFKILDMQFHAIFIPRFSWVTKNTCNKNGKSLLKHEQGHFDLVEEIVRKSKIKTNNLFKDKFFIIRGKNKSSAKKNAILHVTKIRKKIEIKLKKELNREATTYDAKTNHGLIKLEQEKYNKRFTKLR
jgi:hypothetical protein